MIPTLTNLPQTIEAWQFDGIECELRGIQHYDGWQASLWWWDRNYAHKYPDYVYDVRLERIVKRARKIEVRNARYTGL